MFKKKRVLGITLARGGSKQVKNKNIRKILGQPLIAYTIKESLKSKYLTRYIVSTDSNQIKNVSQKYDAETPFLRPKKYAKDTSTSVSALQHAVKWIEKSENTKYDYIVEIMCTNPLKKSIDIDNVIKKIINTSADTVIAVNKIEDHHPMRIKKIIKDKIVDFCIKEKAESRRQDLRPLAYVRSGSIYAIDRNFLMKKSLRYGSKNSRPYILPDSRTINIDNEADFITASVILKNLNEKKI